MQPPSDTTNLSVNCLTYFTNGFCYAIQNKLYIFEKDKIFPKYLIKTILTIPIKLYAESMYEISHVSVNHTMDTVIVVAKHCQIYVGMVFVPDAIKLQKLDFKVLGEQLHTYDITDIATCLWRPIVMTAGNLLSLWDVFVYLFAHIFHII